jgi:hypothetical protein
MYVEDIQHKEEDKIDKAQDRVQWQTLVNMTMYLWVPYKIG